MFCSKCGVQNPDEAKFCEKCGFSLVSSGESKVNIVQSEVILPASQIQRLIHKIVDTIAWAVFIIVTIEIFGVEKGYIIGAISYLAYPLIFEALFQKTIGKMLTQTKVVSVTGEKPSLPILIIRTFCRYIPFEPLSFLFYGQYPTMGWHDRLSGTLVVPDSLTPEQVRSINQKKIDEQKLGNPSKPKKVRPYANPDFVYDD